MIEIRNLTKTYRDKIAVNNLSITIRPGVVTGFLGPNGAGKSTTMKMILGLINPTQGVVKIDGKNYRDFNRPISKIGALIDGNSVNPKFTAKQHLELIATISGISMERVEEVLKMVGLLEVKNKTIGEFSLGMKQRLGIATALVGDPQTLILDEPFNGLDVDGIHWLRELTKELADQGKAVLVSSHLMSEIQAIAERIIVLAQGKLIADMTIEEMTNKSLNAYVKVNSENNKQLKSLLEKDGALIQFVSDEELHVHKMDMKQTGIIAMKNNIAIFELKKVQPSLEELFIELTEGKVDFISNVESKEGKGGR
ncbi:MAG: ABC transporter ATP-binding protein [Syntrophomonadaceae bacterium]|jgi:ABC-2 type transport system ATP-binding protein